MSPEDEVAIERFIRFPHTLTGLERSAVERLLRTDAVAREVAAFFRSFYAELDALGGPEADDTWPSGRGENGSAYDPDP